MPRARPDLRFYEKLLYQKGFVHIGGVDEAGRGSLAGPVFAAAVIFPSHVLIPEVDDSKKLSPKTRERLFAVICENAAAWSVAMVDAPEIDQINIHQASLRAMKIAVLGLKEKPDILLIDGKFEIPELPHPPAQKALVGGDGKSQTVAAASILAKVSRDRWISQAGEKYPQFSFARHKGYGTEQHLAEIQKHGLTPLHRRSFRTGI